MCINAPMSFTSSMVLGLIGLRTVLKKPKKEQLLFATIPLIFSIQQCSEGFVWLTLTTVHNDLLQVMTSGFFLLFALVIWPVLIPASLYIMEKIPLRKNILFIFILIGATVSLVEFVSLYFVYGFKATIYTNTHIRYIRQVPLQELLKYIYLTASLMPFFIASNRKVLIPGILWTISFAISYTLYRSTYESMWCFMAAIISLSICFVIDYQTTPERRRKKGPRTAYA